jgi:hypothetical protein
MSDILSKRVLITDTMLAEHHMNDRYSLIIWNEIRHPTGEVPLTVMDTFYDWLSFIILEMPCLLNRDQFM